MLAFLYYAGDRSTYHNQQWAHKLSDSSINESVMIAKRVFRDHLYNKYLYSQKESDAKKEAELFSRFKMFHLNRDGQLTYDFPKAALLYFDKTQNVNVNP